MDRHLSLLNFLLMQLSFWYLSKFSSEVGRQAIRRTPTGTGFDQVVSNAGVFGDMGSLEHCDSSFRMAWGHAGSQGVANVTTMPPSAADATFASPTIGTTEEDIKDEPEEEEAQDQPRPVRMWKPNPMVMGPMWYRK